ncbi:acetyl/propionyl/methylcrotonyl-CoA carboxylase subunit alpha [Nocardia harenae]|uniref:acetyl/propionyl/methylcrotonyl-CoA carboxylase subunit alpha n=1 Tax=Nocardia harenae TaxID=358707 RepID=UPI00082B6022|nr:acetyl-CoA carboxylase biotin carboxylase subunit [Nocardia harenae]
MFESVLIANRGEIACRLIRACRELGVRTVAVYSEADRDAPHVRLADEAHLLGPAVASESYLDVARILRVAREAGAEAIHPGYGFLSENAEFARAVADAGLAFVGPPAAAIESMGDKLSAREVAGKAGVPVVPGTTSPVTDAAEAIAFGAEHGYPVAVKAMFGGGGRGMKIVTDAAAMAEALESAQREAAASFGRGECYLERYLERPRHIEVQILADTDGTVIHLGDRDCSLQRRHQKLIEEAPAPGLAPAVRAAIARAAVEVSRAMGYVNAGTCEFLLDADGETFYFLEMNTRLQVEHPVTELITGVDLVHAQLRIAAGAGMGLTQDDIRPRGHAIEARINAEDPHRGFVPTPGTIVDLAPPLGPGVRFDVAARAGYEVPPYYDSLIGKLVVWAADRDTAIARLRLALDELVITGIPTTTPFHRLAVRHPQFAAVEHSTVSVEREWELSGLPAHDTGDRESEQSMVSSSPQRRSVRDVELTIGGRATYVTVYGAAAAPPEPAAQTRRQRERADRAADPVHAGPELTAPMQGTVVKVAVADRDPVTAGDLICILEAMKMENHIVAHRDGVVTVHRHPGDAVEKDTVLAVIQD